MNSEFNRLLGIYEPTFHECLIAVSITGTGTLIKTDKKFAEYLDGTDLEDNITDFRDIPKEPGIYKCTIKHHTFKCNIPSDPDEWDSIITIEKYELIDVPF